MAQLPQNCSKSVGGDSQAQYTASATQMQQLREQGSFTSKQQQQQQQQQLPPAMPRLGYARATKDDEHLFQTPSDLVCPITLSLFQDPVCNAVGQVYERAALQRHLLQAAVSGQPPTDPVSNAVLPSLDLLPVWPMRSRAAEYRDSTIHACVQAAAAPECPDPVKYLRRAAELVLGRDPTTATHRHSSSGSGSLTPVTPSTAAGSPNSSSRTSVSTSQPAGPVSSASAGPAAADATAAGAAAGSKTAAAAAAASQAGPAPAAPPAGCSSQGSTGVPGLTLELAQYLVAHRGSQYDALLLKFFGNELLRSGFPDAASNVFYRLLLEAEDRVQQAEYLQLCLDCWTCSSSTASTDEATSSSSSPSSPSAKGSSSAGGKGASNAAAGAVASGAVSGLIVNKLADFVQRQRCLGPRAIIQMLESTHHGSAMAMQLCQVLLARAAAAALAAEPAAAAEAAFGLPGGLGSVLEVLMELMDLGQGQLVQQVEQLRHQVRQLQASGQGQEGTGPGGAATAATHVAAAAGDAAVSGTQESQQGASSQAAAGQAAGRKHRQRSSGHHWRGGKGVEVVVGRVLRLAAAGTLAAASFASGNHPVLRLARVGPLLYLLRAGL